MSTPRAELKTVNAIGPELADVLTEHLAANWKLAEQTSLGGGDFVLVFIRKTEGER